MGADALAELFEALDLMSGQLTAKLVKNATLKVYPGFPHCGVPVYTGIK
jgi:hypothetical protein